MTALTTISNSDSLIIAFTKLEAADRAGTITAQQAFDQWEEFRTEWAIAHIGNPPDPIALSVWQSAVGVPVVDKGLTANKSWLQGIEAWFQPTSHQLIAGGAVLGLLYLGQGKRGRLF